VYPARHAWLVLFAALAPALAAIWLVPWFVTQDGPAHIYNAQIIAWSFGPSSPFQNVYTINWQPIPNWAGHLALVGLISFLPAWVAERIATSTTLLGFAAATFWLRLQVAAGPGIGAALLSALLAINICWLLGFHSFMLGASLFSITLGFWWSGRDQWNARRTAALGFLLILGYFCHLVSLGLTLFSLVVLALASPIQTGADSPWRPRLVRLASTTIACLPLVFLGFFYWQLSRRGGPAAPTWNNLSDPWALRQWLARIGAVDPLTLAINVGLPFTDLIGRPFTIFFAPVVWLMAAVPLWWYGRMSSGAASTDGAHSDRQIDAGRFAGSTTARSGGDRTGWLMLATILLVGGVASPDSLGVAHGQVLPVRVVLLGLVALVPIFDVECTRWWGRATIAALAVAVALQSAIIWDYALYSDRTAGQIIRSRSAIGERKRIVTLLAASRSRFRANPLLHADNWLGVDTGNIVWDNYETLHYYFPVQFLPDIERPYPGDLELVSVTEEPEKAANRLRDWEAILSKHARSIDAALIWKSEPRLEAVTARFFDQVEDRGDLRIFRHCRQAAVPLR